MGYRRVTALTLINRTTDKVIQLHAELQNTTFDKLKSFKEETKKCLDSEMSSRKKLKCIQSITTV